MSCKTSHLFLFLSILLFASCIKEPEPPCTDFTLPGEWILTKIKGLSYTAYFPKDGEYIQKLEIGDSTWREFIYDSLVMESIYTVHYDTTGSTLYRGQITFNNQIAKGFAFEGCSLILSGVFEDSVDVYYERE